MPRTTIKEPVLTPNPTFGDVVKLPELPPGTDMIIVCYDNYQSVPCRILLPHQLYYDTVRELIKEHNCRSISIMPCNSENWITLDAEPFK